MMSSFSNPGLRLRKIFTPRLLLGAIGGALMYKNRDGVGNILINLGRTLDATWCALSVISKYQTAFWMNPDRRLDDTIFDELNEKCAKKIFKLCCRNQGIYCKFGQHVASASKNTKFLPDIYEKVLANLEDQLIIYQVLKVSQLREIFHRETSLNFDDVFTDINPIPIGTASLAQVFKAKLINTGEEVAIKVQHPGIEWKSKWDITVISMILKITKLIFPELNFDFIINAIQKNLHKELDFTKEAENAILTAEEMKKMPKFYIPKVLSSLSSSRILVTQYIKGQSLSKYLQTANECQRKKVVELIEKMYYFMIFNLKKVHADPHAGNLIVICSESNPQDVELALLDHGLYLVYNSKPDINSYLLRAII